jgi:hypothetical protein
MIGIFKDKLIITILVALGLCLLSIGADWVRGYDPEESLGFLMLKPVLGFASARLCFIMYRILKP